MKIIFWIIGLLLVIIVFIYLASQLGQNNFQKIVKEDIRLTLSEVDINEVKEINENDINGLPEPVQKWLKFSQVIKKNEIKTVRLKQEGLMRTKPGQTGMKTEAEQYFNTIDPAFVWKAKVNIAPFIYFAGEDKYYDGKGKMTIKILSLFPVVDAKGAEIDQGTLTRYLGEIVWFPTAALSEYITWEEVDSNTAKATMSYKGTTASGIFRFEDDGKLVSYSCERYYTGDQGYSLESYYAPVWDYKEFSGIKIPTRAKAVWKLDSGDYEYYEMEITDIEYNIKETY